MSPEATMMREFLRGWKRKTGCVSLLMACALMVGWIRSSTNTEGGRIQYGTRTRAFIASSNRRLVIVEQEFDYSRDDSESLFPEFHSIAAVYDVIGLEGVELRWSFCLMGFQIGQTEHIPAAFMKCRFVIIPYWIIVVPLAPLSAWLLLSKPHPPMRAHHV